MNISISLKESEVGGSSNGITGVKPRHALSLLFSGGLLLIEGSYKTRISSIVGTYVSSGSSVVGTNIRWDIIYRDIDVSNAA